MTTKMQRLRELLGVVYDLSAASAVLGWDQQTYMPPGGAQARALQLATLEQLSHDHFVSEEFGAALEAASQEVANLDPDSDDARLVQRVTRDYKKQLKVPSEWVGEFNRVTSLAFIEWQEAKKQSDFPRFAPSLAKVINLRRQYVGFFAPYDHIYDPLLDDFEPGMKTTEVKQVFGVLRPTQVKLLQDILERGKPVDDSVLHLHYDDQAQWNFALAIIKEFGYDFERGRQDRSTHPFTTGFSIGDVRITTRIKEDFLPSGMFSSFHESGHAMYHQGVSPALERTSLTGGASYAFHESQSRMWENMVGRSRPFWKAFYPRLKKAFASQLGNTNLNSFYRAINKVKSSFIRVDADEATYNLHIMLRFDMEIALMQGDLQVDDLPQVWNKKMEEYLGITPHNDAEGVLQDVHWSGGAMGYFPTYALGNLIAAQLWRQIQRDIPDIEAQIEAKRFAPLREWLQSNVHQHGGKFEPSEMLQRITGQGLTSEPYISYLQEKFGEIYSL